MPGMLEVEFAFRNERYDEDDPRWRDQVADLVRELRLGTSSVHSRRTPVPGTKGTTDQLIITLGSAGAFTATVQILRIWLARDKHRVVEVTFSGADGSPQTVRISAENAGNDAIAPLILAASNLAQKAP